MRETNRIGYQDVKAKVLLAIKDNIWAPGTIMPGEVELAEMFGCARATVNRAMRELAEEGILERKRKAGTLVKLSPTSRAKFDIPVIREEVEKAGGTYRYALVDRTQSPAPNWLRAKLGLAHDQEILHVQCMHFSNNRPYQFEDRWINLGVAPDAEHVNFQELGPNEWLLRHITFSKAEIGFSATKATRDIAEFLDCAEGDPLFTSERTTWLNNETITFARVVFSPGYQMTAQI